MRITKEQYREMSLKYQTGEYGLNELAKIYGVDKGNLSKYFKKNNIKINEKAQNAINNFTRGFNNLNEILVREDNTTDYNTLNNAEHANIEVDKNFNTTPKYISENSLALANEVIDIIKRKNPQFATAFQGLSAMMINKSKDILQGEKVTSADINNIAGAMQKMNDTLGVFPKMPTIAQQFNFNDKKGEIVDNKGVKPTLEIKLKLPDDA